jgi:transcriptional regulator with XRE-family HTH domain
MKYLRHHLKTLRESHNLKQEYVGKILGIGQTAYSRIENGSPDKVPLKYLNKLAELYGVKIEDMFSTDENLSLEESKSRTSDLIIQSLETRIRFLEERVKKNMNKSDN